MNQVSSPQRNILLVLQYDGGRYCGWQRQNNAISVQQVVEEALEPLAGAPVKLTAAGRTDAGVHAAGQVVNFHTNAAHAADVFRRAGNSRLPEDVAILEARDIPQEFSARYDARERWYRYRLHIGPVRPVFERDLQWHVLFPLHAERAKEAAALFCGQHDFQAFRSIQCTASRTVLDMKECRLSIDGEQWTLDLRCRSFLHNMVRILVGAIVEVSRGRLEIADLRRALESGQRDPRIPTAPPHGLCLMRVSYPCLDFRSGL